MKESGSYDPWGPTGLVESEAEEGPSPKKVKVRAWLTLTEE